jgi:hypothetical protein
MNPKGGNFDNKPHCIYFPTKNEIKPYAITMLVNLFSKNELVATGVGSQTL